MRRSWFSSLDPLTSTAAAVTLGLLLTTANASAQSRDDTNRGDSDSSSSTTSDDNDRSSSRDSSSDRSEQRDRQSSSMQSSGAQARGAQAGRQTGHATLGVTFYNDQSAPLEIRRVMPGSAAEEAGLERGDEILSVDGRRVSGLQQLRQLIDRRGADEDIELGILRDGRRQTLKARLVASQQAGSNQQPSWNQQQGWNQQQASRQQSYGSSRNRQEWGDEQQYGSQGQGSRGSEYEQGYWAGYERARQELAFQGNRSQGNANRGYQAQGYGNQSYGQSYLRGSRASENWQEDGYRGARGNIQGSNQAFLGVTLDENNRDAARVINVYPHSPAEEAGIRAGDEIVSIDDDGVDSSRDLRQLLSQKDSDDEVSIEVRRGGRTRTLQATLTSQQQFLSSQNENSYRVGRRTNSGEQGSDSRARRQQNRSADADQDNDNDNY